MQRIVLSGTNIETSRLGFGTASLHHLFLSRSRKALLGVALDSGLTHFDTAPMYGEGMAERELGRFLGSARKHITIGTKIGFPAIAAFEHFPPLLYAHRALAGGSRRVLPSLWNNRFRSFDVRSVEQSLKRSLSALKTDWIDLLLVHEPQVTDINPMLKLTSWLEHQKTSGRVRYLGLAGGASNCLKMAQQIPGLFDVLQVKDSIAKHEADDVIASGWPLQITFGYLRGAATTDSYIDAQTTIKSALARNEKGMILVSSRNPERLKNLASLADLDKTQL